MLHIHIFHYRNCTRKTWVMMDTIWQLLVQHLVLHFKHQYYLFGYACGLNLIFLKGMFLQLNYVFLFFLSCIYGNECSSRVQKTIIAA